MDVLKEFLFVVSDGQIVAVAAEGWFTLAVLIGGLVSVVFFTVDDPDWPKEGPGAWVLIAFTATMVGIVIALLALLFILIWRWVIMVVVLATIMLVGGWALGKKIA